MAILDSLSLKEPPELGKGLLVLKISIHLKERNFVWILLVDWKN